MEDLKAPDRVLIGGEQSPDGKAAMEVRGPPNHPASHMHCRETHFTSADSLMLLHTAATQSTAYPPPGKVLPGCACPATGPPGTPGHALHSPVLIGCPKTISCTKTRARS